TCRAARELALRFPNDRSKVESLAQVALLQAEVGERGAAAETLQQAKQAAGAIDNPHQKGNALCGLVRAQTFLGDYAGALDTGKDSGDYQVAALMSFARSLRQPDRLAARKALREAVALVTSASRPDQLQVRSALATAQVKVGDLEGALQTVEPL